MIHSRWFVIVAIVSVLFWPALAAAAPATPTPDAPGAEGCQIGRLSLERLRSALDSPVAEGGTPTSLALTDATPADAATVAGVTATAREFIACLNAQDLPRLLALATNHFLPVLLAQYGASTEADLVGILATPVVPLLPEMRTTLIAVRDVGVLADGRVAAVVVGDSLETPAPPKSPMFLFVQVGDRWLIDGIIPDEETTESTPAP